MITDHLELEGILIQFLKDLKIDGVRQVYGVSELSRIDEASLATPSLHVMYDGEVLDGGTSRNDARKVAQQWMVVVATDNAKNPISGEGNRVTAGKILAQVVNKLSGAKLAPAYFEAKRVTAPKPYYMGTFAYFSLAYEIARIGS